MRKVGRLLLAATLFPTPLMAQVGAPPAEQTPAAAAAQPALPPATKLEGFKPEAGSVITIAYDNLGSLTGGPASPGIISVDVRQVRDTHGNSARGLFVQVTEISLGHEDAFVDEEEIPELLRGIDTLLAVKTNPTQFKNFAVQYTTQGALRLVAFNYFYDASATTGEIQYGVQAGRVLIAERTNMTAGDMRKLRAMFEAGLRKLNTTVGK